MLFRSFSESASRMMVSREFLLDVSQNLNDVPKRLPSLSRCLLKCLLFLLLFLSFSPRAYLSFTFSNHQMFVLTMVELFFLVFRFHSLIRSRVFRFLFSMAEGGCEQFPDHWNTDFFWTVIVEYISHGHPVDMLVKRWFMVIILFFLFF